MRPRICRSQCTLLQRHGEVDDVDSFAHELSHATECNFLNLPVATKLAEFREQALAILP